MGLVMPITPIDCLFDFLLRPFHLFEISLLLLLIGSIFGSLLGLLHFLCLRLDCLLTSPLTLHVLLALFLVLYLLFVNLAFCRSFVLAAELVRCTGYSYYKRLTHGLQEVGASTLSGRQVSCVSY